MSAEIVLGALALWATTAALLAIAVLYGRTEEHEARLDALEREREADGEPSDVEPRRAPIGFRLNAISLPESISVRMCG